MTCKNCQCNRKKPVAKLRNNVALVLDDSSSMGTIAPMAAKAFNSWIDRIQSESIKNKQDTNVSVITFGSKISVVSAHQPASQVKPITGYFPVQGRTALFKGVNKAISTLDEIVRVEKYSDSYLVLVVTDGEENVASQTYINQVVRLMKDKQEEGTWTFVFMLPPNSRNGFCNEYGIPTDNVIEWKQTDEGVREAESLTSSGISNFYNSRSMGHTSVVNFYVQPNLAAVKPTEVKRKLTDISSCCQQFTLAKEEVIKDFVERKTRRPYVVGTAYYQLMKTEKVQGNKKVILKQIVSIGAGKIYTGDEARALIGLPTKVISKVEPGNHSDWEIYIQSTSHNRILSRGTKVIIYDYCI